MQTKEEKKLSSEGYWKQKIKEKIEKRNIISKLYNREEIERLHKQETEWYENVYLPWIKKLS